jgi:hypothetical protein
MRKYVSKIDELRKEMVNTIISVIKEKVGDFDEDNFISFDDSVYLFPDSDIYEDSVDNMRMNEDGDIILYCEDDEVGSILNQSTDVIAEIVDIVLDGSFEYVEY